MRDFREKHTIYKMWYRFHLFIDKDHKMWYARIMTPKPVFRTRGQLSTKWPYCPAYIYCRNLTAKKQFEDNQSLNHKEGVCNWTCSYCHFMNDINENKKERIKFKVLGLEDEKTILYSTVNIDEFKYLYKHLKDLRYSVNEIGF